MRSLRMFGLAVLLFAAGCGDDDDAVPERVVFGAEGNRLWAYSIDDPDRQQVVIASAADDPATGRDINGQICLTADGRTFIAGEDTGQPDPPAGWGVFALDGTVVGELSATQIGKLNTTFQGEGSEGEEPLNQAEPYGCAFLDDGRLITTDVGNQAAGAETGQVILWFPPLDVAEPAFCKLDTAVGTAGSVYVHSDGDVYIASARGATAGVLRYAAPFPTADTAEGGCGRVDATGAPLASEVRRDHFIAIDGNIISPNSVVATPDGTFLVSSVINGVIAEYDDAGAFLRKILEPPPGERLGPEPFSTGTPLGLGVDSDGTVYFADLGLVLRESGPGPGQRTGSVRRIRFEDGAPLAPETLRDGLSFPDGIGVLEVGF